MKSVEKSVDFLKNLIVDLHNLKTAEEGNTKVTNELFRSQDRLAEISENLFEKTEEFRKFLESLGRCPVCHNPFTKESVEKIIVSG